MSSKQAWIALFEKYVPQESVLYCFDLLNQYGFRFTITRSRKSKLGDYRFLASERRHVITINHDLNRYQFLITYLHEVAHLITFEEHQTRVKPHGKEWKDNFRRLLAPLRPKAIFPSSVAVAIEQYLKNPKASSCADPTLFAALRTFDDKKNGEKLLAELKPGEVFQFNKRTFQKETKKRTRSVCIEINTGKQYLISEVATVHPKSRDPL